MVPAQHICPEPPQVVTQLPAVQASPGLQVFPVQHAWLEAPQSGVRQAPAVQASVPAQVFPVQHG